MNFSVVTLENGCAVVLLLGECQWAEVRPCPGLAPSVRGSSSVALTAKLLYRHSWGRRDRVGKGYGEKSQATRTPGQSGKTGRTQSCSFGVQRVEHGKDL